MYRLNGLTVILPLPKLYAMRSDNEQQSPLENPSYREFQLLSEVDHEPDVTQRQLSSRMGMALGLTNVLLRNLIQNGYVKVSQASWKRRLYTLTPDGFGHRLRLMVNYVHQVLDHYQRVRQTLRDQLEPLALNKESSIAIYGVGQFAELVYLGLREQGIEEIEVFAEDPSPGDMFLGLPVRNALEINAIGYDRVVLATLNSSEESWKCLTKRGVPSDKLVAFFSNGKVSGGK